jgi:UDP-N-acetylglucosamine diphosphorylase / glucose-1-phosphate thymidylyltransferase / UDP-N-acetylgalactosamine diphosphorylase / glucosamine-1-phosphate N-acetyltransferase / galactosamine-1-phosphate N-acetyltransferase
MRIAFFEDQHVSGLNPVALMRPVYELLCGQFSLRERLIRRFSVSEWGAFLRPWLAETYREEQPEAQVNDSFWLQQGTTLLINGRWLPTLESLANIEPGEAGIVDDELVYLTLDSEEAILFNDNSWDDVLATLSRSRKNIQASGSLIRHPWDLINQNANQLLADYRLRQYGWSQFEPGPQVAVLGPVENVYIHPRANVDPFVVLDARTGPISIEAGACIQPFTRIEGPCHIGYDSQLFRANIREGTTIGPTSRVGGEVEASILHGYVNTYHDGFLGHSYVCPWVNLGALTTNSDLKNDYSNVKVPLSGVPTETNSNKVGCFIGDHTKTALSSLFNTGSSIGMMSMVLPGGELLPKHIPSFSRVWHGELDDGLSLEDGLTTARTAMGRRNCELTSAQERLIRFLYDDSLSEREQAILRFREKRGSNSSASIPQTAAG